MYRCTHLRERMNYHVTRGREKALLNWLSGSMTNFIGWREISKGCDPFFRAGIYVRSVTVGASVVIQNEAGKLIFFTIGEAPP